jgi:feruloyl-CoA synthase
VARALLLEEPPSIDANEVTDKGSVDRRAVLTRRADRVAGLYAQPYSPHVLVSAAGH